MKSPVLGQERVFEIIRSPQISEKATFVAERNGQIIFRVSSDANKVEIKSAIEQLWKMQDIQVKSVRVVNVKGKQKRFGKHFGKQTGWKKVFVSLKGDKEIDFSDIKLFGGK